MPISNPIPLLALNIKPNGKTQLILPGTAFTNATTITAVTDENLTANPNPYTFTGTVIRNLFPTRLIVEITCTSAFVVGRVKTGTIAIATNNPVDSVIGVPVIFHGFREVSYDATKLDKQTLHLKPNAKSVLSYPITGLAEVGDFIPAQLTAVPEKGGWTGTVIAKQKAGRVKVTIQRDGTVFQSLVAGIVTTGNITVTSGVKITLTGDDGSTIDTPPVDVTYIDPDDDPD